MDEGGEAAGGGGEALEGVARWETGGHGLWGDGGEGMNEWVGLGGGGGEGGVGDGMGIAWRYRSRYVGQGGRKGTWRTGKTRVCFALVPRQAGRSRISRYMKGKVHTALLMMSAKVPDTACAGEKHEFVML